MIKRNQNLNIIFVLIGLVALVYFFAPDIFETQSTVGIGTTGKYSMQVGEDTYTVTVRGTDDLYRVTCDDDPISYRAAQDVERTGKNSFGCYEWRYHKAEAGCETDGRCDDNCQEWGYPAHYALDNEQCEGRKSSYDYYCHKYCDVERTRAVGEWSYDTGISWKRVKNRVAGLFTIKVNGEQKVYFGKTTLHAEDWLKRYKNSERDMETKSEWRWEKDGVTEAKIENIQYTYISSREVEDCSDVKKEKTCQLWGYHAATQSAVCVNWGGDDTTEKYEIVTVCTKSGGETLQITGDFVVGDKVLSFCHGHSSNCNALSKANGGKNYIVECKTECGENEILDFESCKCIDRSDLETRESDVGFGREGTGDSLIIEPGENATLVVFVDLDEFDADREFHIELDANAVEYDPVTETEGTSSATELFTWAADEVEE